MGSHYIHGLGTQFSRKLQDFGGNADLTQIMEHGAAYDVIYLRPGAGKYSCQFGTDYSGGDSMGNRMRTSEINGVSHHPQEGIPLVLRKRDVLQDFIKFSFQYIIQ